MNRGQEQVIEALENEKRWPNQLALARFVGLSQGYLSRVVNGELPGLHARQLFRKKLKISLDAWEEKSRARVKGAA